MTDSDTNLLLARIAEALERLAPPAPHATSFDEASLYRYEAATGRARYRTMATSC